MKRKYSKDRYEKHKHKTLAAQRLRYATDAEFRAKRLASVKANTTKNPMKAFWRMLHWNYGLTPEAFYELIIQQDGCCAGCEEPLKFIGGKSGMHVDHDHETKKVRGLLCRDCNLALGYLRDKPETATRLVAYLIRSRPPPVQDGA